MADYSKFKNANGDDLVLQDKELRDNVGFDSFTENEKILAGNINHNTAGIILVHDGKIINANESSGGLYYDDSREGIFVNVDGDTIIEDYKCLSVANPVPDTNNANDGDVLSYDGNTDEIVWVAPHGGLPSYTQADAGKVLAVNQAGNGVEWTNAGGGGGGNPYTKTTVTPGNPYDTGKTHEIEPYWVVPLYDQDVIIENNTYSILSSEIGYCLNQYDEETPIDTFNIRLPEGTDFPMAVVEFNVDSREGSSVNNIIVYVGETRLTRIFDTPYISNPVKYEKDTDPNWGSNIGPFVLKDNNDQTEKYLAQMDDVNLGGDDTAFPYSNRVQVYIFGNCYKVSTNWPNERPVYAFPQS